MGLLKYRASITKTSGFGTMDSLESLGLWPVLLSISLAIKAGVLSFPGICSKAEELADI